MCWWYQVPGVSPILYIFCRLSWEVSIFFVLLYVNPRFDPIDRVLLVTIWNKGLHPCPQCLIPKSKLDETGMKRDSKFRLKNVRTYLFDYIQIAQDAIYRLGAAIAGEAVNRLLKTTSSVPIMVRWALVDNVSWGLFFAYPIYRRNWWQSLGMNQEEMGCMQRAGKHPSLAVHECISKHSQKVDKSARALQYQSSQGGCCRTRT